MQSAGMQREIRFRFWNRKLRRMSKVLGVGVIWEHLCDEWGIFDWPDVVKLQYIGMKDRDRTDVYEGDIIQDDDDADRTGIIGFELGAYYCTLDWGTDLYKGLYQHGVVIGNVHESPELLNEEA